MAIVLGRRRGLWIVVAALVGALALCLGIPETNPLARGLLWVWPGLAILGDGLLQLAAGAWMRGRGTSTSDGAKRALLGLWLVVGTFATVRYVNRSAKYMLLPLPAAILLTLDAVQGLEGRRARIGRWALALSLPLSLTLGATVALSDYRFAGLARAFFAERYPSLAPSSGTAYFDGEWGMRYYAERAGVPQYRSQHLRPGDRVLYSKLQGRLVLEPCPALPPDECTPVGVAADGRDPAGQLPGPVRRLRRFRRLLQRPHGSLLLPVRPPVERRHRRAGAAVTGRSPRKVSSAAKNDDDQTSSQTHLRGGFANLGRQVVEPGQDALS